MEYSPPRLSEAKQYIVTASIALISLCASLAFWNGIATHLFLQDAFIMRWELWRLVTPVFIHADILHLLFNCFWLWFFGTLVEKTSGHKTMLGLFLIFALGSAGWDYALMSGGIGLSGVVYGFFGMTWMLARNDERFKPASTSDTVIVMMAWLVICILAGFRNSINSDSFKHFAALSVVLLIGVSFLIMPAHKLHKANGHRRGLPLLVMLAVSFLAFGGKPIANVAHVAGLVLGIFVGFAFAKPAHRPTFLASALVLAMLGVIGATVGRPYVNLAHDGIMENYSCYDALMRGDKLFAVEWCDKALQYAPENADTLMNAATAHYRNGENDKAEELYTKSKKSESAHSNNPERNNDDR